MVLEESEAFVFDLSVRSDARMSLDTAGSYIRTRDYNSALNGMGVTAAHHVRELFSTSGEIRAGLEIRDVVCGGGSAIVIELPHGVQYLVSVFRDALAKTSPSTLDISQGWINTSNPILAAIREAVEEVLILYMFGDKGAVFDVVIPQFAAPPWSDYNGLIRDQISGTAEQLGLSNVREIPVETKALNNPLRASFGGVPCDCAVTLGYEPYRVNVADPVTGEQRPVVWLELVTPPMVMKFPSLGRLSEYETLWYETGGKAPERDVVLFRIDKGARKKGAPEVIVYQKGIRNHDYDSLSFGDYRSATFPADRIESGGIFTPPMSLLLRSLGLEGFLRHGSGRIAEA
jgi:hypothetical protein